MTKRHASRLLRSAYLVFSFAILALASSVAIAANAVTVYKINSVQALQELPASTFRQQMEALPGKAQQRAIKWMNSFRVSSYDLQELRVDNDGAVFYAENFLPEAGHDQNAEFQNVPEVASSALSPIKTFALHSKPESKNVAYLDFKGGSLVGSAWGNYQALPYDIDGNPSIFSSEELANIAEIWRRVAEDYAPFDIDITTEEPSDFTPTTGHVLITQDSDAAGKQMPSYGAGGVAYVSVWATSFYNEYSPTLVYYNRLANGRADVVAEASSHELGHNLGLSHDGNKNSSYPYDTGHGNGNVSWGPIMGASYNRNVSQWSKGEYAGANNHQDDIAIIDSKISIRSDDHGNTKLSATPLKIGANGNLSSTTPETDPDNSNSANKGIIENREDVDVFSFTTSGGKLALRATPASQSRWTRGGNLDIKLSLYDANGGLVDSNDPPDDTDATLNTTVSSGTYYLSVDGVGSMLSPYSDYGSLGQYFISGNIPASGTVSKGSLHLSMRTSVTKRANRADLSWDGAKGQRVDVYLNGSLLKRTANDGRYRYVTQNSGSYLFKVCEINSSNCSNEVSVQLSELRMILRTAKSPKKNLVNIRWAGASGMLVDIYDGDRILARAANNGFYRYKTAKGDTHVFNVCEAGTTVCSNKVSVRLRAIR